MRVEALCRLSRVLRVSLIDLLNQFASLPNLDLGVERSEQSGATLQPTDPDLDSLRQEYQRLQTQLQTQRVTLEQDFQQASLQILESWLLQFPTAAYAAQQNPQVPAVRLLPLMHPVEQLIQSWGVEAIVPVGTELAYDPQQHQLMDGTAQPGDRVRVRYTGYRQGSRLLYRAKVSPVDGERSPPALH
jgi:molecular chaperone GrpE (heat shock protein)